MAHRPLGLASVQYKSVDLATNSALHHNAKDVHVHIQLDEAPVLQSRGGIPLDKVIALAKWLLTILIGVATAHIAFLVSFATSRLLEWKFDTMQSLLDAEKDGGGLPGSSLLFLLASNALFAGSGIPEIKSTLNGVHVKSWMSVETLVAKIAGVILSISGGLPVGMEGPMIHCGAIVASCLSSKRRYKCLSWQPMSILKKKDVRDLVTCGAAAGVAAAFGAPIGGVLFALEEGASFLSPKLIWRAFFCAMVALFVVFGSNITSFADTAKTSSLFAFGKMRDPSVDRASYLPWELLIFIAVGSVGGIVGAGFTHLNQHVLFRAGVSSLARPSKVFYIVGISILFSLTWMILSGTVGTCLNMPPAIAETEKAELTANLVQYACPSGQYNDLASLVFVRQDTAIRQLLHLQTPLAPPTFTMSSLIVMATLNFLGTAIVLGASISSGVFVPSIIAGAALGRAMGQWMHADDMDFVNVGTYALVGAAAVLGGVTRITISLTIILLEATGDLQYALPLMMTLMAARWVGNIFSEGLYEAQIQCRGIPFLDWNPPKAFDLMSVTQLMALDSFSCLSKRASVDSILAALIERPQQVCWVVVDRRYDSCRGVYFNVLEGTIERHVLVALLHLKSTWSPFEQDPTHVHAIAVDEGNGDVPEIVASAFSAADRTNFINLRAYMNPSPVIINSESHLSFRRLVMSNVVEATAAQAYRHFRTLGLSLLCVISKHGELQGVVTRDQLHALTRAVSSAQTCTACQHA
ncbi:hypothetical protein AeMF1_015870 [Aphanomyces euteiches]|nr:hypothetical protein AeMF1_015870 [Aphanomyces euteiches]KAH9195402.1 hypothetical protein AeNC1_002610 [Aphanomyces euteiches]